MVLIFVEGYTDPFLISERIVESSPQVVEESAPPATEEDVTPATEEDVTAVESPVADAQAPLQAEPVKPQEEEEEMPDLGEILSAIEIITTGIEINEKDPWVFGALDRVQPWVNYMKWHPDHQVTHFKYYDY